MGFNSAFKGLIKLKFSRESFEKFPNTKFHEKSSSGGRVVSCGRTDMMKLTIVFRNSANAPKNQSFNPTQGKAVCTEIDREHSVGIINSF